MNSSESMTPSESIPAPNSQQYPLPQSKPFWVFILLGSIIILFLIQQLIPLFASVLIPFLNLDQELGLTAAHFSQPFSQRSHILSLIILGANVRDLILQGQTWRLFTSIFLHVDLTHLIFNAIALIAFGAETERLFGRGRFIAIYILAGLFGSLASMTLSQAELSAGASGAIFGLIGIQAAYFLRYRHRLGEFSQGRLSSIGIILVINIFLGLSQPNIDNWAHMGGLISGFILGYILLPRYKVVNPDLSTARLVDATPLALQIIVLLVAFGLFVIGTQVALLS